MRTEVSIQWVILIRLNLQERLAHSPASYIFFPLSGQNQLYLQSVKHQSNMQALTNLPIHTLPLEEHSPSEILLYESGQDSYRWLLTDNEREHIAQMLQTKCMHGLPRISTNCSLSFRHADI